MNLLAFRNVLNFLLSMVLGLFVFYKNPRSRANQLFLFYCLSVAFWDFIDFNIVTARDIEEAEVWSHFDAFGPTLPMAFIINFVLIFTEQYKLLEKKLIHILIYGPVLFLGIIDIFTGFMTGTPVWGDFGFEVSLEGGALYFLFSPITAILSVLTFLLCSYFCVSFLLKAKDVIKKKQVIVFLSAIILVAFLYAGEALLSTVLPRTPPISLFGFTALSIIIAYAMLRYELFTLNPVNASDSIISAMSDILILFDLKGRVVFVNPQAVALIEYSSKEFEVLTMPKILPADKNTSFSEIVNRLNKIKALSYIEGTYVTKHGKERQASLSFSAIRGRQGELRGVVCIARDISQLKRAEEQLKENTTHLEKLNKSLVGRELRMIELKQEIKRLKNEIDKQPTSEALPL